MKKSAHEPEAGFAHLALIGIVVLALVAGTGVFIYGKQQDDKPLASSSDVSPASLNSPLPDDLLSVDKLKEKVAADKPGATIRQVELESEGAQLLYKVSLADGSFVLYNARSGIKVTKTAGEKAEVEKGASLPTDFTSKISFEQARSTALQQKPGGKVSKIELEVEEGKVVYSVRFSDGGRVDVDASNGAVVRSRAGSTQQSVPAQAGSSAGSGQATSGSGSSGSGTSKGSNSGSGSSDSSSGSGSSGSGSSGSDSAADDSDSDDDTDDSGRNRGSGSSGSGSDDVNDDH